MSKLNKVAKHIKSIEEYSYEKNFINNIHPLIKILVTSIYIFLVISCENTDILKLIFFILYPTTIIALCAIPGFRICKTALFALPFTFFAAIVNCFIANNTYTTIIVGTLNINVTYGFVTLVALLLKTFLTVLAGLLLVATSRLDCIAHELHRIKVPSIFITSLILTYRYIGVLLHDVGNVLTAYRLRSYDKSSISIRHGGSVVGTLILQSFLRSEKIYSAMLLRHFDGNYKTSRVHSIMTKDIIYGITCISIAVIIRIL